MVRFATWAAWARGRGAQKGTCGSPKGGGPTDGNCQQREQSRNTTTKWYSTPSSQTLLNGTRPHPHKDFRKVTFTTSKTDRDFVVFCGKRNALGCVRVVLPPPNVKIMTEVSEKSFTPKNQVRRIRGKHKQVSVCIWRFNGTVRNMGSVGSTGQGGTEGLVRFTKGRRACRRKLSTTGRRACRRKLST